MAEWRRISARISACAAPWFARVASRVASTCPLCLAATRGGRVCLLCHAALRQGAGLLPPAGLAGVDEWCQAFAYAPPGDVLIWQYKVSLRLRHARLVASLMAEAWQQRENDCRVSRTLSMPVPVPVLVPVPSSRRSLARRGFNPARELSRHLAGMLGLRERPAWLLRHETRHKQAGLGREARRAILDGVFYCPALPEGAAVILVDDVVTTGSTASAAARALKAAGASRVAVLAAARVPPPGKTPAGQVS